MKNIPSVKIERASYENIKATCPCCGHKCIFNRISDLCTTDPIGGREVHCLNKECDKLFRIGGDLANERHEMLILDCYELLDRKQYMHCILNIATAYEMFFSLFLRVRLVHKPFAADSEFQDDFSFQFDKWHNLLENLEEKTNRHTFRAMRALCLRHMVNKISVPNLCQAEESIECIPKYAKDIKDVSNSEIEAIRDGDEKLIELLKQLKCTRIHELRNKVVHKRAYRPTRREAEEYLEEARSVLFPLTFRFELDDDPNLYLEPHLTP